MNASVLFHFEDEDSQTWLLNLDEMLNRGGNLKDFAEKIIDTKVSYFSVPYHYIYEVWEVKEIKVSLPATIDKSVEVFLE